MSGMFKLTFFDIFRAREFTAGTKDKRGRQTFLNVFKIIQ